jgi:hypothetical protein
MPDMRERERSSLSLHWRLAEDLAAYLKSDIEKWQTLEKKGAFK